jgi:ribosomal protein S18 acetylase RimI-like enzyme
VELLREIGDEHPMKIRRATEDDAAELARVHVDSWRAAYRGLVPDAYLERFEYGWREERFRESLSAGTEETYLIQVREQVMGFLTLGAARDADLDANRTGEIWGIYVSPDHWRRGIGRTLAAKAEQILASRGYEDAVLWVLEDNEQARRFYEAMGFASEGQTREIDWGALLRAVRYAKVLASGAESRC